jgi:hypothetical protein
MNGAYTIQDKEITASLQQYVTQPEVWDNFFAADGVTGLEKQFVEKMREWVSGSAENTLTGLENFPHGTMTHGTSEAFQMFMMRHNDKNFKFFKGDFMMHKVASNVMGNKWKWIHDANEVTVGSAIIISIPFSDFGTVHPQHIKLLERCSALNVPVLIDCAYFGMCYGIDIDLHYKCIEEVTFSLGKTFPIIGSRCGVRFQRIEVDDAVTFANQHGIVNNFGALVGLHCIENYSADFIATKYRAVQQRVCDDLGVDTTNCILFATSSDDKYNEYNRGNDTTRLCISKLIQEEYENRR